MYSHRDFTAGRKEFWSLSVAKLDQFYQIQEVQMNKKYPNSSELSDSQPQRPEHIPAVTEHFQA